MKKETIKKSNTGIAIFEIILEFENKNEKKCLHTSICLLMAYRFVCVMWLYSENSLMLNSIKQMRTFLLLKMFCQFIVLIV